MDMQPVSNPSVTVKASAPGPMSAGDRDHAGDSRGKTVVDRPSIRRSVSSGVRDLHHDGSVSSIEESLYAIMHPGETPSFGLLTQYSSRGDVIFRVSGMPRLVDLSV